MPEKDMTAAERAPRLDQIQAGPFQWTVRADLPASETLRRVLQDPEAFLQDPAQRLKHTRTVTLARVPAQVPGDPPLVVRRLNYGQFRHRLRDCLRSSRAQRALRSGLRLEGASVATPRALAALDRRRWRWPVAAYLVTEEVSGALNLGQYLGRHRTLPAIAASRIASLLARLHNRGFSHRDLKWTNILLDPQLEPYLIDLDGIRRPGRVSPRQAAADLARLARHFAADRVRFQWSGGRFLIQYCRERGWKAEPRILALRILAIVRRHPGLESRL